MKQPRSKKLTPQHSTFSRLALATFVLFLAIFSSLHPTSARPRWVEAPQWSTHFQEKGVTGTFLLYDVQKDQYTVFNRPRSQTRFLPASTFKILNSMIALDAGAVRDENETLPWDKVERSIPDWNQDQNMKQAFANSTVWFYQTLARRVGEERMSRAVNAARYGNRNIGGGIDHFWLDGALRISPVEQVQFLKALHQEKVPFSPSAIAITKRIMVHDQGKDWVLRAKTGWVSLKAVDNKPATEPQVGWWVGYVERAGNAYCFALNIDIKRDEDAATRLPIAKTILRQAGLID